jgi:ABC-type transport system substrate-binding protein
VLAFLVVAGGPAVAQAPKPGGQANVAFSARLETLNPPLINTSLGARIAQHMFETLTTVDDDGHVRPLLAERWAASPDGLTWTFTLRRGVRFHDGTPFNAQAVVANFNHVLDPNLKYGRAGEYPVLKRTEAVDEHTVRFHLSQPWGPFPAYLTRPFAGAQVSPAAIAKGPEFLARNPVGTGPFKLEKFVPGQELLVARNDAYWGKKPYLDRLRFVMIPEAGAREAALQAGDVHLAVPLPPQFERTVSGNPALQWRADRGSRLVYVGINMFRPEFQDFRIRQAMDLAIDRDAILANFLRGLGRKPRSYVQSVAFGFLPVSEYPFDPARAAALLKEAGWTKGKDGILEKAAGEKFPQIVFRVFQGRVIGDLQAAQAVAGYLQEVGFPVVLRQLEHNVHFAEAQKPENKTPQAISQLSLASIGNSVMDGSHTLKLFDFRRPIADAAFSWYHEQDVWPYVDTMLQQSDPAVRLEAIRAAQKLMVPKSVWLPLYEVDQTAGVSKTLKGLKVGMDEGYWLWEAWLDK